MMAEPTANTEQIEGTDQAEGAASEPVDVIVVEAPHAVSGEAPAQATPTKRGKRASTSTKPRTSTRKTSQKKQEQVTEAAGGEEVVQESPAPVAKAKAPRKKAPRAPSASATAQPETITETVGSSETPEATKTVEATKETRAAKAPAKPKTQAKQGAAKKPTGGARKTAATGDRPPTSRARKKPTKETVLVQPVTPVEPIEVVEPVEIAEAAPPTEAATPPTEQILAEAAPPAEAATPPAEQIEAAAITEAPVEAIEREFEPELDMTPVKPRTQQEIELREKLFSDLVEEAPPGEAKLPAPPFEIEETRKRPSVHLSPFVEVPETPAITGLNGHTLAPVETDLEVSPVESDQEVTLKQQALPRFLRDRLIAITTQTPLPEILETPHPELEDLETETAKQPEAAPTPAPVSRPMRGRVAIVLLLLIALSLASIWQDVSNAHLYLYTINLLKGQVQAQQDLGRDYSSATLLTNPVLAQSSLLVGLPGSQRILSLSGGGTTWSVGQQFDAPFTAQTQSTLSVVPGHYLIIAYAGGLQVLDNNGVSLWQVQGTMPSQGAHAYAPAYDGTTLYTVRDANKGVIAAYNLANGTIRWQQKFNDTFNYAPPALLYGDTLYIASDHNIYALNRANGSQLWQAAASARTLLIDPTAPPQLIEAGATGLASFDARSGAPGWVYSGYPKTPGAENGAALTGAPFYQAELSPINQVVYTTGIVWDEQQARQQLWLYAVDASTGSLLWSEMVGSATASADAGRVLTPLVIPERGLVLLETAQENGSHTLAAYDATGGSLRWSIQLAGVTAFAPDLFQAGNDSVGLFVMQADMHTALRIWSWLRALLLALSGICLLLLLGLWLVPLRGLPRRTWAIVSLPWRGMRLLFRFSKFVWRRRPARLLLGCLLIALIAGTGTLAYLTINRPHQYLNAVEGSNGNAQWQHTIDAPTALSGGDGRLSYVVTQSGEGLSTLDGLNADGSIRWSTPASEGNYSLPAVQSTPGTLLVVLSGPTSLHDVYAPGDPAYANRLAHLFTLELLDKSTGRVLWQTIIVHSDEAQDTIVLGADAHNIYLASRSIPAAGQAAVVQLIAVDMSNGAIAWRLFGPREDGHSSPDFGSLLPGERLLYWQSDGAMYALDTQLGQIQWRAPIAEVNSTAALIEEPQMALNGGILLIRRSDKYYALDPATGNTLWSTAGLGTATPQSPGGMLVAGGDFILYGSDTIEALDPASQAILWRHDNLANVLNATVSPDGSLVYAVVIGDQTGASAQQALVAIDVRDSSVRWTFQPSDQMLFSYPGAPQLRLARGMLYVTACLTSGSSSCTSQILYGLNSSTGVVSWKFEADQVIAVQASQDNSAVIFQTSSSIWENLKARFLG